MYLCRNTCWVPLRDHLPIVEQAKLRALCNIIHVSGLTMAPARQALPPQRHRGMWRRHYTADVAAVVRLLSAALAQSALAGGIKRSRPFRACAAVQVQGVLDRMRLTWGHAIADFGDGPAYAMAASGVGPRPPSGAGAPHAAPPPMLRSRVPASALGCRSPPTY